MNRQLGIAAIVIGAAFGLMGVLVLVVPEPSVGLGIGFLVIGVLCAALGIRLVRTPDRPGPQAARPWTVEPPPRPKSTLRQILDGLTFFR